MKINLPFFKIRGLKIKLFNASCAKRVTAKAGPGLDISGSSPGLDHLPGLESDPGPESDLGPEARTRLGFCSYPTCAHDELPDDELGEKR